MVKLWSVLYFGIELFSITSLPTRHSTPQIKEQKYIIKSILKMQTKC